MAEALGLPGAEGIIMASSAVEAANATVKGFAWGAEDSRKELVAVKGDPEGWTESCISLERYGYILKTPALTPDGGLDGHSIDQTISDKTALTAISSITPQVYAWRRVEEISKVCNYSQVVFALDITNEMRIHIVNKYIEFSQALVCDGLALGCPIGGAVLWIKPGSRWSPLINGGEGQDGLRGGHYPLGQALALARTMTLNFQQSEARRERFQRLLDVCLDEVIIFLPDVIMPAIPERAPLGLSFMLPGLEGEALVEMLRREEVYISAGSGCVSKTGKPSPVLTGMDYDAELASGAVQVDFRDEHTEADVKALVKYIAQAAKKLWRISGRRTWKRNKADRKSAAGGIRTHNPRVINGGV